VDQSTHNTGMLRVVTAPTSSCLTGCHTHSLLVVLLSQHMAVPSVGLSKLSPVTALRV
jgi:hypothetical protein